MEKKNALTIEAPWYRYRKMLHALFEGDPEIGVGEVCEAEGGGYALEVRVSEPRKLAALGQLLRTEVMFGSVRLAVRVVDAETGGEILPLYEAAFRDNPIVKDVRETVDPAGVHRGYVRFRPEVVQFFDDDLSDYSGNWTGLAQDIAAAVFTDERPDVSFCTADKRENEAAADRRGEDGA